MTQRARRGRGVYGVKVLDFDRPVNQQALTDREATIDPDVPNSGSPTYSNKTVAAFVLDVRSHKTPWKHGSAAYQNDPGATFWVSGNGSGSSVRWRDPERHQRSRQWTTDSWKHLSKRQLGRKLG